MTKIFVASDHAGIELKSKILHELQGEPYEVNDLGPFSADSVDYPDYADLVCKKMHGFVMLDSLDLARTFPSEMGILICGSGQGMAMRANKFTSVRAALCWNPEIARLAREHNDANVLCLGARAVSTETNLDILKAFIKTPFAGGRHRQRVVKVSTPV